MNTQEKMQQLKNGDTLDVSLGNELIRSSKEANAYHNGNEWLIDVYHYISDCYTTFTEQAFIDVLNGKRDVWDGDVEQLD